MPVGELPVEVGLRTREEAVALLRAAGEGVDVWLLAPRKPPNLQHPERRLYPANVSGAPAFLDAHPAAVS